MLEDALVCHTRSMKYMFNELIQQFLTVPNLYKEYSNIEKMKNLLNVQLFADGEMEIEVLKTLRNKNVFILAGSSRNSDSISLYQSKIETYNAIDAIKRSGARSITAFIPYFSSSRSDRLTRRNSVGFWIDYKIMVSLGVNHIITFQLHSKTSKTAVDPTLCAMDDIPVVPLLQEYIATNYIKNDRVFFNERVRKNWVFCSVDAGGEDLAKTFARCFGTDLIIAHKRRSYKEANVIESLSILTGDDIEGKEIWIADDMIDTGGSMCALMDELIKRKVADIKIVITHAIFSKDSSTRLKKYHDKGYLSSVIVSDTIEITDELKELMPFLEVVNITKLVSEIIISLSESRSLSPFLEGFSIEQHFKRLE